MAQATLSDWYNSRAWDEPENLEFPAVAMKFEDLSAWFKAELKSDCYDRLDAALIADDAVDFYLVGYYSQPGIIYPANSGDVYAALDAAKELFLQEGLLCANAQYAGLNTRKYQTSTVSMWLSAAKHATLR